MFLPEKLKERLCAYAIGLLDNEDIHMMMQGSSMVKVRSPRWQKSRSLRLLEDGLTVWCESTKSSRKAKAQQTCEYVRYGFGFELLDVRFLCVFTGWSPKGLK